MAYSLIDGAEVWKLAATHGLPLDFSLPELARSGRIPTWDRLLAAARADGTDIPRLGRRLHDIIGDTYSPDDATVIRQKLVLLLARYL